MAKHEGRERRMWRRRSLSTSGVVAGILAVAAVGWACTLQVGTFKVCGPIPIADLVGGACTSKTGSGSQAGSISVSAGDPISITATGMNSSAYSVLYTDPANTATSNCHLASATGVTSLLGYNAGGSPNTLTGPDFSAGTHLGTLLGGPSVNVPSGSSSGTAKVCTQDEPNRVTGNQVSFTIL
ncbi:MAG: hypothetical protein ACRDIU_03665 [Actinomycetota bacterium]